MNRDIPFVDKNNERSYLIMRAKRIIEVLGGRIFTDRHDCGDFLFREGQAGTAEGSASGWRSFGINDYWGEREFYAQFRQTVEIPADMAGKKVVYEITCYPDDTWRGSAQQFILKVDGKIAQGIDANHTFCILSDCAEAGRKYDIFLNAYYDDDTFRGKAGCRAYLKVFDDAVNAIYYDLKNLWESAHIFGADDTVRVDLVRAMNEACNILELESDDREEFDASCAEASEYLRRTVFGAENDVVMSSIGHTHIDVAWRWRLRQTREKAGRSFATVLNLMKEFPDYKFMSPQAQLYDYVKRDYPEVFEGIKQAVKDGRWEVEGSMWVESDTNIISGESLVRQFLFGKRFFRDEFGVENKIMWLPDVFGYSAALPQIMAKSDIKYFMTTKIGWNEYTRFPYDTFVWKGIDGTGILSHFIPARSDDDANEFSSTYNASLTPRTAYYSWKRYSQKDINKNFLCSYGHGDGGGGPERCYLENSKRLSAGIPGIPKVRQEFAGDFFDRLDKEVSGSKYLPSWRGELYLEYHRGVLTAQARNKKYNRKCEYLMHDAETLCELDRLLTGAEYPRERINECWKLILLNQFHDIIPGSSIAPVYEDSKEQYEHVLAEGGDIIAKAKKSVIAKIAPSKDSVVVFNTLGFERDGIVSAGNICGDVTVYDGDEALPTQRSYDGNLIFLARGVPAKGYKVFSVRKGVCEGKTRAADGAFENDFYRISFDENMNIASYFDKKENRYVAPEGCGMGAITAYQDRSHVYEAWDIKCYYNEKSYPVNDVQAAKVIEDGPVRTVLRIDRRFKKSTLTQYYVFTDGARVDICYDIDWKEKNIALKACYPVDVNTDRATFDIQFGNLERSTTTNTLADFAQFEVCGHKWADLSDSSFGFSVFSDCKYGYTVKDGKIEPTLLRSATSPNVNQDRERHTFTYALMSHPGDVRNSTTLTEGYMLNVPMTAEYADGSGEAGEYSLVSVDNGIIIETVKKAEDSDATVIRMYEYANKRTVATLRLGFAADEIRECNLMEKDGDLLAKGTDSVTLTFRPFEIKTVKVK